MVSAYYALIRPLGLLWCWLGQATMLDILLRWVTPSRLFFLRSDISLKLAADVSETDAFDSFLRPSPDFAIELRRVAQ